MTGTHYLPRVQASQSGSTYSVSRSSLTEAQPNSMKY